MKKWFVECPFCKNEIKEGAKKCQYCWEFLNPNDAPSQEVPGQTVWQTNAVKKKSSKVARIIIWIVVLFIIIWNAWKNNTSTTNDNSIWMKVQERVNYVNTLFEWELTNFEKVECIWDCNNAEIAIYFTDKLNKEKDWVDEDTVARWQSLNLTNTIGWQKAVANVYVSWKLVEKCEASNQKVNYCEIDWKKEYNHY